MANYISRGELIGKLTSFDVQAKLKVLNGSEVYNEFLLLLSCIPAADVEPVRHGRWINKAGGGFWEVAQCSVCGSPCPTAGIPPRYCPRCGAKMDLEGEK